MVHEDKGGKCKLFHWEGKFGGNVKVNEYTFILAISLWWFPDDKYTSILEISLWRFPYDKYSFTLTIALWRFPEGKYTFTLMISRWQIHFHFYFEHALKNTALNQKNICVVLCLSSRFATPIAFLSVYFSRFFGLGSRENVLDF